jgi:hypothetical protein
MAGDPRDDPRAHDLLSADPGVVSSLVGKLQTVAMQAQSTADGLHGAAGDATWTGSAATAFRQGLGKLPGDLGKVTSSYQEAGGALDTYEGELSSLQPAFQRVVSQLGSADTQLANAHTSLSNAQSALTAAQSKLTAAAVSKPLSPLPSVPINSPLISAVSGASSSVGNAQGEIAALSARGFQILDEFESARNAAKGRLSSASQVPPHRSFWDSVFHDVGDVLSGIGHFAAEAGEGIFNSVTGTLGALENFANDPTLANFGKLASDAAVDASIVALAATAPEALGLVGAAEAGADGAAEEGASLLTRAATGLSNAGEPAATVTKLAVTGNAGADLAQGHYADAGVDAVFMAIPDGDAVADHLGVGEQQAEEAATQVDHLDTFSWLSEHGFTPSEALPLMSEGEVDTAIHNITDLSNPDDIAAARQSLSATATSAARTAARVGAPVAFAIDGGEGQAQTSAQAKIGHLLHPQPSQCP